MNAMSNEQNPKIEVRDLRAGDWLWTNKTILFSELPDSAYRVYSALAAFADNKDQRSWPSMLTIAQRIHSSKSTVVRAMKLLEACKLVQVDRRDGTSNLYTLLPCKDIVLPTLKKEQSPHHQLIKFFEETTKKTRGVKIVWSPKEFGHLKRVLAYEILTVEQIEQLMLFFLASPQFAKFTPSFATFFSGGIFTGLMNTMKNDPDFYKQLDRYAMQCRIEDNEPRRNIPMRSMQSMVAQLAKKMSMS